LRSSDPLHRQCRSEPAPRRPISLRACIYRSFACSSPMQTLATSLLPPFSGRAPTVPQELAKRFPPQLPPDPERERGNSYSHRPPARGTRARQHVRRGNRDRSRGASSQMRARCMRRRPAGTYARDDARTHTGRAGLEKIACFCCSAARLQATASSDGPHACLRSGSEEQKPKQILYLFASPDHLPSPGLPGACLETCMMANNR
jgi:hypothetical protein